MLQESRDRIRTMALIHEKLYKSADLSHIDFSEYLRNLVSMLVDSYAVGPGRVELDLDIRDTFLSLNAGIPCGLIVNELVSNALKHAFPGGRSGRIRVELKPLDPPKFKLVICDDGAGFPEGLDFRNAPSLGLQVVTMLVAQLRGTIELHRDRGTCFVIVFEDAPTRRRP
jgi:two-component sensor histidine kinase